MNIRNKFCLEFGLFTLYLFTAGHLDQAAKIQTEYRRILNSIPENAAAIEPRFSGEVFILSYAGKDFPYVTQKR